MLKKIFLLNIILIMASCTYLVPAAGRSSRDPIETPKEQPSDTVRIKKPEIKIEPADKNTKEIKTSIKNGSLKSGVKQAVSFSDGNIRGLSISAKNNGTMIKIDTTEEFGEKDVAVSISADNFLSITIYRGKLDKKFPDNLTTYGNITDISYFAFAASTQLTVKLKKKVASKSVIIKPDKIIISLFENE